MYPGFHYHARDLLSNSTYKQNSPYRYWCRSCQKYYENPFKQDEVECKCGRTGFLECECGSDISGHVPNGEHCRSNK